MRSNYRRIGDFIRPVKVKNSDGLYSDLQGINIDKFFMPSVANTVGVDLKKYKIIKQGQFACNRMHVGRDYRIPIALSDRENPFIVSPAYDVFEIKDKSVLLPEYLMMWFSRKEFDRNAWFYTDADVRGGLPWKSFCDIELPIPSIEKQREIVKEYNTVVNRIKLKEQLNQKLEETAQALYKHWFVDFEFPNKNGEPYKSSGGAMVYNEELDKEIPEGWVFEAISNYIKINSGYAFKSKWWTNKGLPVIKIGAIQNNSISEEELEYIDQTNEFNKDNYQVQKGDIVIAMTGFTMGKIGLVPDYLHEFFVNQRVGFYKLNGQSGFLYCSLKTEDFQNEIWSFGGDSQQFNVSNDQVGSIKILQPINSDLIENFNSKTLSLFDKIIYSHSLDRFLLKMKNLLLSKMTKVEQEKEVVN